MQEQEKFDIMRELLRVRISQMIINEKYKQGEFKIPIHLAFGHEAIAVAVSSIMDDKDRLVLSHRNIHYNLARASLKPEIDEYLLKEEGLSQGQLGSMNLANESKGIIYTSSILGNNLPVATGLALSKKAKNEKGIVILETGDGACEEGTFYESLLFAKSNELPLLIIVENNKWSLATKIHERRYDFDLRKFSESLDIKYEELKGNDVYKYIKKLEELKKYSIENKTPVCIEVELTTLGCWVLRSNQIPNGKFVNYHGGPARIVNLVDGSIITDSDKDPVFVLQKYYERNVLKDLSNDIQKKLEEEII
jgi:pyruvate dehydrogenase E1 component alpha subunit